MKILLIEDSRFLRQAIEKVLLRAGYTVITAADGDQAVRIANSQAPDAILLDLLLPKMTGLQVLKLLKQAPLTSSIPVIVLTSLSQVNAEKLVKDGAAAYLEKTELMFSTDVNSSTSSLIATVESVMHPPLNEPQSSRSGEMSKGS